MKNLKRILVKHWWIILVILGIIGWFYWFQIRPSMIYSSCHSQAILSTQGKNLEEGFIINQLIKEKVFPDYESHYKACLRSKGINK